MESIQFEDFFNKN